MRYRVYEDNCYKNVARILQSLNACDAKPTITRLVEFPLLSSPFCFHSVTRFVFSGLGGDKA